MRHAVLLAIASLIVCCGTGRAQEIIAPPAPDPLPPGVPQAPPAQLGNLQSLVQQPAPPSGPGYPNAPGFAPGPYPPYPPPGNYVPPPPGYYGPAPQGMYGPPPPGYYGAPPPPPVTYGRRPIFFQGDPAADPNGWLTIDSLIWWSKNQPLPVPLITTGPASQGANAGALGTPGTVSLNQPLNYGASGGIWLTVGGWFTASHVWGLEGDLFTLGQQSTGFGAFDRSGNGNLILNEPVVGAPFSTQVSAPGVQTGGVDVRSTSQFWGGDLNGLFNLYRRDGFSLTLLGGFRYLQLDEHVNIVANSALFTTATYTDNMGNTLATAPPGSTVTVIDQFGARNQFYGGQTGLRFQYMMNRWSIGGTGTIALGTTHETVTVNGVTNVYPINGSPVSLSGGNYASLQTGSYSTNRFAVAPGFQLTLGYQFTPFIRGTIGYNFLYLSNVARPGNQIDNTYDGVVHPIVPMTSSSYWTQGLNLGLRISF